MGMDKVVNKRTLMLGAAGAGVAGYFYWDQVKAFLNPYIGSYLGWEANKAPAQPQATPEQNDAQAPADAQAQAAAAQKAAAEKAAADAKAKQETEKRMAEAAAKKAEAEKSFFTLPIIAIIGVCLLAVLGAAYFLLLGDDVDESDPKAADIENG